ncbi:MAG: protein phosphatase 2C domain-containing protein [Deltaproteobacteria bacterium]|nr:MAG: protein phosphatase 2C domain-containing protein [Deltaproteobacteria bacterium]
MNVFREPITEKRQQIINIVKWKLGLLEKTEDEKTLRENWAKLIKFPDFQEKASKIATSIAEMLEQYLRYKMDLENYFDQEIYEFSVVKMLWESQGKLIHTKHEAETSYLTHKIYSVLFDESIDTEAGTPDHHPDEILKAKTVMATTPLTSEGRKAGEQTLIISQKEKEMDKTSKPALPGKKLPTYTITPEDVPFNALESPISDFFLNPPQSIPRQTYPKATLSGSTPTVVTSPEMEAAMPPATIEGIVVPKEEISRPVLGQWQYLPVPEGPDKHEEHYHTFLEVPGELKLIGARVRGKSHKHGGTNCDDWFECSVSGDWTIIAVSDGAGSKKFSRVGAKASCRAAMNYLAEQLNNHRIKERKIWDGETFRRDSTDYSFDEADLEFVQQALHQAMHKAYQAVEQAAEERKESEAHQKILGENQELNVNDLSATLLLAAHSLVKYKNMNYSFILTCQVGDGMLAAVDNKCNLRLLGVPDTGEYAGQTDFLTSKNKLERFNLMSKTFGFFSPMRALLVMSDGVADDYFPNDPGMLNLWGDLIINGVLELKGVTVESAVAALKKTKLAKLEEIEKAQFHYLANVVTPTGIEQMPIRTVGLLAEQLGIPLPELMNSPELLWAAALGVLPDENVLPAARLQSWLDSYQVRGSADDRTLVILSREILV